MKDAYLVFLAAVVLASILLSDVAKGTAEIVHHLSWLMDQI